MKLYLKFDKYVFEKYKRWAINKFAKQYFLRCVIAVMIIIIIFLGILKFLVPLEKDSKEETSLVITVKTTFKNHRTRVKQIYETWYQFLSKNIYFVTDSFDPQLNKFLNGNLVNTSCSPVHDVPSLNCKLNAEMEVLISKNATWSCRFDDDNYVNIPLLLKILATFNPNEPHYLGRSATPIPSIRNGNSFWYGTGGAGVCISNAALQLAKPKIANLDFIRYQIKFDKMYDDLTLGYLMSAILKVNFTEMPNFYSHINDLKAIPIHELKNIPVFGEKEEDGNFVALPHFFDPRDDPYKFHTLQCFLYPEKCTTLFSRLPIHVFDIDKVK